MSRCTLYGEPRIFGIDPRWVGAPIQNLPPGAKVRVRFRQGQFAFAFVRTVDGITKYALRPAHGNWKHPAMELAEEQAVNRRLAPSDPSPQ